MRLWKRPLAHLVLVLLLVAPGAASATQIFENSDGLGSPGSTRSIPPPATDVLITIDFDASTTPDGAIFSLTDVQIDATGDLTFDTSSFTPTFPAGILGPVFSGSTSFAFSTNTAVPALASGGLFTIEISGTAGTIELASGDSNSLSGVTPLVPFTLVTVPEPGTLALLSLGLLAGVSVLRRSR